MPIAHAQSRLRLRHAIPPSLTPIPTGHHSLDDKRLLPRSAWSPAGAAKGASHGATLQPKSPFAIVPTSPIPIDFGDDAEYATFRSELKMRLATVQDFALDPMAIANPSARTLRPF